MSLSAGTRLGPYEILAPIGAGGMGEVYKAADTRLHREVAIKVSAERFSERFEREARAIASLNHPNICSLFDVGPDFLVMELVGGPTLADRINQGAIPMDESLEIARQIADALEAAHEKGVVHRDLKPANIKIKPDGMVKVLDFGLARMPEQWASSGSPDESPTLTLEQTTKVGSIMGTAAYMSPEQASAKPVDKRADIWSFGVVLWEMLTGHRLFEGETISHTLADVLRGPIDFEKLPRETSPEIRELLRRCLDRNVKSRLRDIGEARVAINNPKRYLAEAAASPQRSRILPWAITAAGLVVAAVVSFGSWRSKRPVEQPLVRLDVDLGADISLSPPTGDGSSVIISPDGTRLVYVASVPGGEPKLFTRRLDQPKATELTGTEGASGPFFSDDGQWVGFSTGNKLSKIAVEGGAVVRLGDFSFFAGANWGKNGDIIVGQPLKGLVRIPPGGVAPTPVTEVVNGEIAHVWPQILPGGKAVLFVAFTTIGDLDKGSVEVISLVDRRRKVVARGGTSARYLQSGHLVYVNKGTLFAIPFDLDRLETHGTAVPVLEGIAYDTESGGAQFDISRTGTLIYRIGHGGPAPAGMTIVWLDGAGKKEPLLDKPGVYREARLSPDGRRLALAVTDRGNQDIWVYEWQHGTMTRLTFDGLHGDPVWSPDGRYVVFDTYTGGMFWTRSDGAGQPQPLTQTKNFQIPASFTPDGKRLAYHEVSSSDGGRRIWTVPVEDNGGTLQAGKPEQFLKTQFNEDFAAFSPDGRWMAYSSDESGKEEVYVRAFPAPAPRQGGKWQISNNGGDAPKWSRSGHELLYFSNNQIMAVGYSVKGDTFLTDRPRVWLAKAGQAQSEGCDECFDVSQDGKRVAVLTPGETKEAPKQEHEVVFLLNFFDELRRRVPVGK